MAVQCSSSHTHPPPGTAAHLSKGMWRSSSTSPRSTPPPAAPRASGGMCRGSRVRPTREAHAITPQDGSHIRRSTRKKCGERTSWHIDCCHMTAHSPGTAVLGRPPEVLSSPSRCCSRGLVRAPTPRMDSSTLMSVATMRVERCRSTIWHQGGEGGEEARRNSQAGRRHSFELWRARGAPPPPKHTHKEVPNRSKYLLQAGLRLLPQLPARPALLAPLLLAAGPGLVLQHTRTHGHSAMPPLPAPLAKWVLLLLLLLQACRCTSWEEMTCGWR